MKDEIEIVDDLIKNRDKLVRGFYFPEDLLGTLDLIKLIDYITNLQKENEELKQDNIIGCKKFIKQRQIIERLNNVIDKLEEYLNKIIDTSAECERITCKFVLQYLQELKGSDE